MSAYTEARDWLIPDGLFWLDAAAWELDHHDRGTQGFADKNRAVLVERLLTAAERYERSLR